MKKPTFEEAFKYLSEICREFIENRAIHNKKRMQELIAFSAKFKERNYSDFHLFEEFADRLGRNDKLYLKAQYVVAFVEEELNK